MNRNIKSYLHVFPIFWWISLVLIASLAIALFPFDDISFAYIMKPNVLRVIRNTAVIGTLILALEFAIGCILYVNDLWSKSSGRATLIHVFGGVIAVGIIAFGLVVLFYSSAIVDDYRFQWDMIFMFGLLSLLNYWIANRILLDNRSRLQDRLNTATIENAQLLQQVESDRSQLEQRTKDIDRYRMERIIADKNSTDLSQIKNQLASQLEELEAERLRLREYCYQLNKEKALIQQALENKEMDYSLLQQNLEEQKDFILKNLEKKITETAKPSGVCRLRIRDKEIFIREDNVAYCYGYHKKNEDPYQEIVMMDGTRYYPGLSALRELSKLFPSLKRVSRNYLIAGSALLDYQYSDNNQHLLSIIHRNKPILFGKSYWYKKEWVLQHIAANKKQAS